MNKIVTQKLLAIRDAMAELLTTEPDLRHQYSMTENILGQDRDLVLTIHPTDAKFEGRLHTYEIVYEPGVPVKFNRRLNKLGVQHPPADIWDDSDTLDYDYEILLKMMRVIRGEEFVDAFKKYRPQETD